MTDTGLSSTQAARAVGIPLRVLNYWISTGLFYPSVSNPSGRGNRRKFSFHDVYALRLLRALRDRNVSLQSLRLVDRFLRKRDDLGIQDAHARLVFSPGNRHHRHDLALVYSDKEVVSLLVNPGQFVEPIVIDAGELSKQVNERLAEIRRERETKIAASKKRRAEKERNRAKRTLQRRASKAA